MMKPIIRVHSQTENIERRHCRIGLVMIRVLTRDEMLHG